ncbi:Aste57867_16106 [Aphanomyces stellatus]|uniref:Aste57867_16106 protein n=1 Tax=Aphanomyces stellatus TaxID=120398 RepID=A0A485L5G0_9STRA|nr:hypothetical protein As57867_016050 [Aphanomyces stellatus]VFT92889.1 Aste57867_16106 [Aphanomyces stellatus]
MNPAARASLVLVAIAGLFFATLSMLCYASTSASAQRSVWRASSSLNVLAPRDGLPNFVFVGDSITELAVHPELNGFQNLFQGLYVRRADMINRGNGGWTSRQWLAALPTLLAERSAKPPLLTLLFLGANDACFEGCSQFVPLDEYVSNLATMVKAVRQTFNSRVLLVTPPPVDDKSKWNQTRSNANTGKYAAAVVALGRSLQVPSVDLWTALQPNISTIFFDGLHPNVVGNAALFNLMRARIAEALPDLTPEALPVIYHFGDDPAYIDITLDLLDQANFAASMNLSQVALSAQF